MRKPPILQAMVIILIAFLFLYIRSIQQKLALTQHNLLSRQIAANTSPGPTSNAGGINCIVGTPTITPIATNNVIAPPIECSPSPTVTGSPTATTSPTSTGTVSVFTSPSPSPTSTPPPPDTRLEITLPIACGGLLGIVGSVTACINSTEIIAEPEGMIFSGEEFKNLTNDPICRIRPGCLSQITRSDGTVVPGHYHALVTLKRDETNSQTIKEGRTSFFVVAISGFSADSFGGSPSPTPSPSPSSTSGTGGGGTGGTGGGPSGWLDNFWFGHSNRVSFSR